MNSRFVCSRFDQLGPSSSNETLEASESEYVTFQEALVVAVGTRTVEDILPVTTDSISAGT